MLSIVGERLLLQLRPPSYAHRLMAAVNSLFYHHHVMLESVVMKEASRAT